MTKCKHHPNQVYLIQHRSEQVSSALRNTIHTLMTGAYELRKAGLMTKPVTHILNRRLREVGT
ncbi:hypothetical protein ACWX0P_27525 [Vibrio mediterranei]